ncbi:MAG: hypothetical protein MUF03_10050 [Rubrivivax sp.]|jgi:hypothetical protein|nr:hypothetical protein [Rubrivivax sp.]
MSEFDGIADVEGWRRKLRALLDEAAQAARDDAAAPRFAVAERLLDFTEHSFPNGEEVRALDAIARQAARALLERTIDERLRAIVERNAELSALGKGFETAAAEAAAAASRLRLERVGDALQSLGGSLATLRALAGSLQTGRDDTVIDAVERAIAASRTLRDLLEREG